MTWLRKHWQDIIKVIWRLAAAAMFLISSISFASFILEEAIQSRSQGMWPLTSNRMWKEAQQYLQSSEPKLKRDIMRLRILSKFNPISGTAFQAYAEAETDKLTATKAIIMAKVEGYDKPNYGIPLLDNCNPNQMIVQVTRSGKCFHPDWSDICSKYKTTGITLAEARKRGLYPANTWRQR